MEPSVAPIQPDPTWIVGKHALMNVRATSRRGRTEIDPLRWRIPFQWQGYHYQDHDDQPFMLLLNSGGGFVEGDVAHFHGVLEPGTRALFTTTASSKFYKCPGGGTSREIVDFQVGADALLEFCPDEAIPFARSRAHRINRIDMAPTARLFATDMVSAGRVHYGAGEVFRFDHLVSEFRITIGGRLAALDRLVATAPETIAALERLWLGRLHMATAFAYAPDRARRRGRRSRGHRRRRRHRGRRHPHRQPGDRPYPEPRDVAGPRGALQRVGRAPPCRRRQERAPHPQVLATRPIHSSTRSRLSHGLCCAAKLSPCTAAIRHKVWRTSENE